MADEVKLGVEAGAVNPYNTGIPEDAGFQVKTNLPEKTGFWTKLKNALLYEVKVELTPYQQKVEDEVNEFLHQEITWAKTKSFLFQEIKWK